MTRLFASFADPDLAEKATGALLDHGARPEDITLVHGGQDENSLKERRSMQTASTYGNDGGREFSSDRNIEGSNYMGSGLGTSGAVEGRSMEGAGGSYAPEAQRPDAIDTQSATSDELIDRRDNDYIYENRASDADVNDPHYAAATRTSDTDYAETRAEDRDRDDDHDDLSAKTGISTTTGADAGSGAVKGAGIGLGVGIAAALVSIFVPGVGLVVGGGALATALGGVAAATGAGAAAGAVTGYLKDQGVDEQIAADYEKDLSSGGAMLEVHLPSGDLDEVRAREILEKYGASRVANGGGYMA
jgi:hypothetical protein